MKKLHCNGCGRNIQTEQGELREGAVQIRKVWDYFSEKDGEIHSFCLCEGCYDRIRGGFALPVEVEQAVLYV